MDFKFLFIYNNPERGLNGWAILEDIKDVEYIKNFYSGKKDFMLSSGSVKVNYRNEEELWAHTEVLPISLERANVLQSVFQGDRYGFFEL